MSDLNTLEDQISSPLLKEEVSSVSPTSSSDQELHTSPTSAAATSDEDGINEVVDTFIFSNLERKIYIMKTAKQFNCKLGEILFKGFGQIMKKYLIIKLKTLLRDCIKRLIKNSVQ